MSNGDVVDLRIQDAEYKTSAEDNDELVVQPGGDYSVVPEKIRWGTLKDHAAAAAQVADGSITREKIADGAIDANKLAAGAVGGSAIADDSIEAGKLQDNSVDEDALDAGVRTKLNRPSGTGGLDQAAVDARVAAGVANWAETGNTDTVPANKLPESVTRQFGKSLLENHTDSRALATTGSDSRGNAITLTNAPDLDTVTHGIVEVEASFSTSAVVGGLQLADTRDDATVHISEVRAVNAFQFDRMINGVRAASTEVQNAAGNRIGEFGVYLGRDSTSNELLAFVAFKSDGGGAGVHATISARISIQFVETDVNALVASRMRELAALPEDGSAGQWILHNDHLYRRTVLTGQNTWTITKGQTSDPADETNGYIAEDNIGDITPPNSGIVAVYWTNENSGGATGARLVVRFISYRDPDTFTVVRWGGGNLDTTFSDSVDTTWTGAGSNRYQYEAPLQQVQWDASDTLTLGLAANRALEYWQQHQLRGAQGPKGDTGAKGDQGDPGQDGSDATVSDARIDGRVSPWARNGNTDPIPAGKLANAPAGGGGGLTETQVKAEIKSYAQADNPNERVPENQLPEKLDELMDSFNLVGWVNEGNSQNDNVFVGVGRRSAYTSSNIAGVAYSQSVDFSPSQLGWHIPIRVPDQRLSEVAAGDLRLQLDDEEFVVSNIGGAGRWQRVHSGGGFIYYQVLVGTVPVGTQLVQHNERLALTEDRVKAIAEATRTFPTRSEEAVSQKDYYLASNPDNAPDHVTGGNGTNEALGDGFLLPGTWTQLWSHTEAAKALLYHKIDIQAHCAWTPSGGGDRGFCEWRVIRRTSAGVESVEERDNLYIRNMPPAGTPIQDVNGISRYRYIRFSEEFLYEAGDTIRLEVKCGSQRSTSDFTARSSGANSYIRFAGDTQDSEARNSVITLTKMRA